MPTPIPGMLIEDTARELMGGLFGSGERTTWPGASVSSCAGS